MVHKQSPSRLLGLTASLAGLVAVELVAGPFFVPEPPNGSPALDDLDVSQTVSFVDTPDISDFSEIVERPLFAQSRRPPEPDAAPSVQTSRVEAFDLVGVISSPAGSVALLRKKQSEDVLRGLEGEEVGGWKIREIKPTEILLERGDFSELLTINDTERKPAPRTRKATPKTTKKKPEKTVSKAAADHGASTPVDN